MEVIGHDGERDQLRVRAGYFTRNDRTDVITKLGYEPRLLPLCPGGDVESSVPKLDTSDSRVHAGKCAPTSGHRHGRIGKNANRKTSSGKDRRASSRGGL